MITHPSADFHRPAPDVHAPGPVASAAIRRPLPPGRLSPAPSDPLTRLRAVAEAAVRSDARQTPAPVATLDRRLIDAARRLSPPPAVAQAAAMDDPLANPLVRGWLDQILDLPPLLVLLVLAQARWFTPHAALTRRRRATLARAVLDGLGERHRPVDHHLAAYLLPRLSAADGSAPVIGRGLAAYAAGDDVTCLHLLVPCVEALLRAWLAERLTAAPPGTPRPTLQALVRQAADHPELGAGVAGALRDVLLAGGDDSLRHRLAHGRLSAAACSRPVSQEVMLGLLRLVRPGGPQSGATTTALPRRVPARVPA